MQRQDRFRWEPSFAVVRSFLDQLVRADDIDDKTLAKVEGAIDRAEDFADRGNFRAAAARCSTSAEAKLRGRQYGDLRDALDDLADSFKRNRRPRPLGPLIR